MNGSCLPDIALHDSNGLINASMSFILISLLVYEYSRTCKLKRRDNAAPGRGPWGGAPGVGLKVAPVRAYGRYDCIDTVQCCPLQSYVRHGITILQVSLKAAAVVAYSIHVIIL